MRHIMHHDQEVQLRLAAHKQAFTARAMEYLRWETGISGDYSRTE